MNLPSCHVAEALQSFSHDEARSTCIIASSQRDAISAFPGTVIAPNLPFPSLSYCGSLVIADFVSDRNPPSVPWFTSVLGSVPDQTPLRILLPDDGTFPDFLREALEAKLVAGVSIGAGSSRVDGTCPGQGYQWFHGRAVSLTFVIMAYRKERLEGVTGIIRRYAAVPYIRHTILIWNGLREINFTDTEEAAARSPHGMRLTIISETVNSLNNRFKPALPVETAATLVGDDDCFLKRAALDCLWTNWNRGEADVLMGLEGRGIAKGNVYAVKPIHFILPRTWIMPSSVRRLYFSDEYTAVRRYVDTQAAHCDDIAVNLLLSNRTQKPHLLVDAVIDSLEDSRWGLTSQTNRMGLRTECTRWLLQYFGGRIPPLAQRTSCRAPWPS